MGALAAQGAPPPPPDDLALLMEQGMQPHLEATPGAMSPDELIEQDLMAQMERQPNMQPIPRPSARYQPPPTDDGLLMGNQVQGSGRPSARYQPPIGQPPAMANSAGQVPQGAQSAAAVSPPPTSGPMQGPMQASGASVDDFLAAKDTVGGLIDPHNTGAANQALQNEYRSLMDAAREGFPRAPGAIPYASAQDLTNLWDAANTDEGLFRHIQTQGQRAADSSGQKWLTRALGFGSAASPLAVGALTGIGAPGSLAVGAGLATAAWAQPRAGALQAKWLSQDTSAMMNRLSNYGSKPYGSLTSGFGDMLRDPPPSAAESSDVDSGTTDNGETSSLSPGEYLGRGTTHAMLNNAQLFMPYADDYSHAGTDDKRAAVTERLYRTDPQFAANVFPTIRGGSETA